MLSGKYCVVSDEKLPPSQRIAATDSKRATKKENSNNDDVSLQSTNKENIREANAHNISDTSVSNLHMANAHTKQKAATKTKNARETPSLALMLNGENPMVKVEEFLPPQQNAATTSKKALEARRLSKGEDEEQKPTAHPQVPMRNPDANRTHEGLTLAEAKESKKGSADMQSHTQPLPNPNKKRDNEANHALLHENA
jgi:hypothetical protein